MVSSPVSDGIIAGYEWMYIYYYTESDNSWHYMNKPTTQPLNPGQGYLVWPYSVDPNGVYPPSPDSAVVKGNLNYQDINLNLSNTDASPKSGWNLVGNPFPIALNWNGDVSWSLTNVGASNYIKDPVSGNYVVWNFNSGGTNPNGGYIAATQSFWVRTADTTGTAASMTLPSSQRSHNNASFYKNSEPMLPQQLLVSIEKDGKSDKTIIGFLEEATAGFDGAYDATYLYGDDEVHSMYSKIMETKYALNHLPSIEEYPIIPVGFEAVIPGSYTFTSEWMESFPLHVPIFLEDIRDDIYQDLRSNPEYVFVSDLNDEAHRFNIHFAEPLGIDESDLLSMVHIYAFEKTVYINLPDQVQGDIFIYNLLGEQIANKDNAIGQVKIPVNASNSYFVIKVIADKGFKSEKLFIK